MSKKRKKATKKKGRVGAKRGGSKRTSTRGSRTAYSGGSTRSTRPPKTSSKGGRTKGSTAKKKRGR